MAKQTAPDLKKSEPARPDRALRIARQESGLRVEELKRKLLLLTDKYFEQSLITIKRWMREPDSNDKNDKRG